MTDPIRKKIVVPCDPDTAFRIFAKETATWWPLEHHSLSAGRFGQPAKSITIEPRAGGRILETAPTGEIFHWGSVKTYAPGKSLSFSWHVSEPVERSTEVEVLFNGMPDGRTEVVLEHRNWDILGEKAEETRGHYNNGWVKVFEVNYGNACSSPSEQRQTGT